jgi:hypothetical protein
MGFDLGFLHVGADRSCPPGTSGSRCRADRVRTTARCGPSADHGAVRRELAKYWLAAAGVAACQRLVLQKMAWVKTESTNRSLSKSCRGGP